MRHANGRRRWMVLAEGCSLLAFAVQLGFIRW
jgi:hypothetical protein